MRFYHSIFVLLTLLVIANAWLPNLKEVKNGMTYVPSRFGFPIAVNATKALAQPQLFFNPESEVQFELYTLKNKDKADILLPNDINSVTSSHFNKSLPTRIYVHGWQEHGNAMRKTLNDAYFNRAKLDLNLIAVNWDKASWNVNYVPETIERRHKFTTWKRTQNQFLREEDGNTALTGHTIFFAPDKFDNKLKFVQFMCCYLNGDVLNSFVVD